MIKCFIVVNNTGVPRLTKFYEHCVRFCLAFSSHSFHNYLLTTQRNATQRNATQPLANNYDISTNMQTPERQQELVRNVFEALHSRADGLCNFVEDAKRFGKGVKLIYRHFATLYFAALVDENESELGILDLIHVFVETLDSCFENVCELDLVFNSGKAYAVLDEIIMAGAVIETSSQAVLRRVDEIARAERFGVGIAHAK